MSTETPPPSSRLRVFCGLMRPDLEDELARQIDRQRRFDPLVPLVILVGSRQLSHYLARRLLELRVAFLNIHFITFAELSRGLTERVSIADPRPTAPSGLGLTAASMAVSLPAKPNHFATVAEKPGFRRALASSFRDVDDSTLDFDRLLEQLTFTGREGRTAALREYYRRYRKALDRFRDPRGEPEKLPDPGAEFQRIYETRQLTVYGFYDFTGRQFQLLRRLSESLDLDVFLPWQPEDDFGSAFSYAKTAKEAWEKLPDAEFIDLKPAGGCECKGFGGRLFRYEPTETSHTFLPLGRRVQFFRAADPSSEASAVVERINELALHDKLPLDRIGVMLWNPAQYREPLLQAFDDAGLPVYDAVGATLEKTPEGRTLTALWALAGDRLKRRDLFDFLAGCEVNFGGEVPDEAVWECISVDAGLIEANREGWRRALTACARQADFDRSNGRLVPAAEEYAGLQTWVEGLFENFALIPEEAPVNRFALRARVLTDNYIPPGRNRDAMLAVLSDLERLDDEISAVPRRAFADILTSALAKVRISRGSFGQGVMLIDRMSGRGAAFDALFMPGLYLGAVPQAVSEDPILPDEERRKLHDNFASDNPFNLPLKNRRRVEDRMLFALAVDSARERLILSYPAQDPGQSSPGLPSRYLLEVARVMTGRPVDSESLLLLPQFEDDSAADYTSIRRSRRVYRESSFIESWIREKVDASVQSRALAEVTARRNAFFRAASRGPRARHIPGYTPWDGVFTKIFPPDDSRSFPVTDLEAYARCPFQYFIRRRLKAQPWEEPEQLMEIEARVIGTLVHKTLETLYCGYSTGAKDELSTLRASLPTVLDAVAERLKRRYPASSPVWNMTIRRLKLRLDRFLTEQARESEGWSFQQGEAPIAGAIRSADGGREIHYTGKIDRIDAGRYGERRILDYKTGRKTSAADDLDCGRALQLPLYLKALLEQTSEEFSGAPLDPTCCQAEYLYIDGCGSLTRKGLNGVKLRELEKDLADIVFTIVDSMREGLFPPLPENETCSRCDVSIACPEISRRKSETPPEDTRLARLFSLRGDRL